MRVNQTLLGHTTIENTFRYLGAALLTRRLIAVYWPAKQLRIAHWSLGQSGKLLRGHSGLHIDVAKGALFHRQPG